jgi:hypothetical protein
MDSLERARSRSPLSNISNLSKSNNNHYHQSSMTYRDRSNEKENIDNIPNITTSSFDQHQWQWDPSVNPLMKLAIVTSESLSST